MRIWIAGLVMAAVSATNAWADPVAERGCSALTARVDAIPGSGPVFLRSYDDAETEPALAGAAFTYDNALAVHALIACGRTAQARRIGIALLAAVEHDRAGAGRGRLRNAYRAGAQDGPPQPNGWWDGAAGRWAEDPHQVGTATGNVAWAGLALMALAQTTGDAHFLRGAQSLAQWVVVNTADGRGPGGFRGGIEGDGAAQKTLGWKSTEHNVDVAALFSWLGWRDQDQAARAFLDDVWNEHDGYFLTGTKPDGVALNTATSGLDAQLWPQLLPNVRPAWVRAVAYAEKAHGVAGGFDFNDDRDGIWWEGTAQAALTYRAVGRMDKAQPLLDLLAGQFAPGGLIWATSVPRLTTGLALGPDSTTADFVYWRRPHLGATAWAVLAATGWNPLTGKVLGG